MSKQLIRTHHLRRSELLGLEGYHQGINKNQLGLGGSVFPEQVLSARQGLVKGELFIHSQSPEIPLIKYSRDYRNYYLNPEAIDHYEPSALAAISQRFPELDNDIAERLAQGLRRGQIIDTGVSLDPPEPLDYHFEGNNIGNGTMTRDFWIKARFVTAYVSHQQDKADRQVVGNVPYRLYNKKGGKLLKEDLSSAEGYMEWGNNIVHNDDLHYIEWAPVGTDSNEKFLCSVNIDPMTTTDLIIYAPMHELLFSPNEHYLLSLTKAALDELEAYDSDFDKAARRLKTARGQSRDAQLSAQREVRELLRQHASGVPSKGTLAPQATGKADFSEVIRLGARKYSLVPQAFIDKYKRHHHTFTDIPSSIREGLRSSIKREDATPEDALKPWRHTDESAQQAAQKAAKKDAKQTDIAQAAQQKIGNINPDKLKQAFGKAKATMSKSWGINQYTRDEQIPSSYIVAGVFNQQVAEFFDDELSALDDWIAQVNQDAKVSYKQYQQYHTKALAALDKNTNKSERDPKKYFLPEDWDIAKRSVLDIWGNKDDLYYEMQELDYDDVKLDEKRRQIRDSIYQKPLPASQWDGSAGAQLMRYSLGASAEANFDLLEKGKLAIGASGEFDAALAEAKAEGSFYYPNSEGHPLRPKVQGKQELISYIPYRDRNNASNSGIVYNSKQPLPYFAVDSSFLTPAGAEAVFGLLDTLDSVLPTAAAKSFNPRERKLFIQVLGHTSATGDPEYNKVLGLQRAMVVTDFIRERHKHWFNLCLHQQWGQDEIDFMSYYILLRGSGSPPAIDWQRIGSNNTKTTLVGELRAQLPDLDQRLAPLKQASIIRERFFIGPEQWYSAPLGKLRSPHPTRLHDLMANYQRSLMEHYQGRRQRQRYDNIGFHSSPFVSKGESTLKIPLAQELADNRRCELLAWEIQSEVKEGKFELYLGDMYARVEGHISAWAGVNIALGGEIAVASPKGALAIVGAIAEHNKNGSVSQHTIDKSKAALSAGANAAAFAGAKAELGLKASIQWRQPLQVAPDNDDMITNPYRATKLPEPPPAPSFKAFGSVGYTVTGLLGVGFNGNCRIGFDDTCKRFVIKVHAQAALGPGIGGQLDIVIGIGELWDFVIFVHGELKRHHFSYLDLFETKGEEAKIDVFELFNALAWKMFTNGKPLSAIGTLSLALIAEQAIDLLKGARDLVDEWEQDEIDIEQVNRLTQTLADKPTHIQYLTPETKGRILFDLLTTPYSWGERWHNWREFDLNKQREDATLSLLFEGTHSQNDWRETLEHIGDWQGDTLVRQLPSNASPEQKAERVNRNLNALQEELLDDSHKWSKLMQHISTLPQDGELNLLAKTQA